MASGADPTIRYCSQCGQPHPVEQLASFGDVLVCPHCKNLYIQKLREGVALAPAVFTYGGFWIRFVALLIDGIILGVAGSAVQLTLVGRTLGPLSGLQPDLPPDQAIAAIGPMLGLLGIAVLINISISACYEAFFVSRAGATPGKMALGLKVVRPNGAPLSLGRAFGRYFAKWLSSLTFMIGYLIAGFDPQKRALHDMICDTRVVKADSAPVTYVPQV